MSEPPNRYVLHDPDTGRWWYYLPTSRFLNATLLFDGVPAERGSAGDWYASPRQPARAEWVWTALPRTVSWRLKDQAAESARFPATLTPEEYEARVDPDDEDSEAPEFALYERVTVPGGERREEVDLTGLLRLDGAPPAEHPGVWTANLPYELGNHPEYRHLFPGFLAGYKAALGAHLKAMPYVQYVLEPRRAWPAGVVEVTLQVPYEPAWRETVPATNRDGSRSRSRTSTVEHRYTSVVQVPAPLRVPGSNLAEATAAWRRMWADAVDAVQGAADLIPCRNCEGTGVSGTRTTERP